MATWSGWVGLGELTGFGPVKPLPGISDWTINTAVTLPIGVEAYAAYALHAWLSARGASEHTRAFAKWSALGSLLLGMLGQVGYHLLAQTGATAAPWQVTTVVSCLPVLVLGMGAALGHMLARDAHAVPAPEVVDEPVVEAVPERVPEAPVPVSREVYDWAAEQGAFEGDVPAPAVFDEPPVEAVPAAPDPVADVPGPVLVDDPLYPQAVKAFFSDVASGEVPPVRAIKQTLGVGQSRAVQAQAYLRQLVEA